MTKIPDWKIWEVRVRPGERLGLGQISVTGTQGAILGEVLVSWGSHLILHWGLELWGVCSVREPVLRGPVGEEVDTVGKCLQRGGCAQRWKGVSTRMLSLS